MEEPILSREAKYGERMIEVRVRFWTNDIAQEIGEIVPKHAWTSGIVRMERNESHGIVPENPRPFDSFMELPTVIAKVLMEHGVILHRWSKMAKYIG